MRNVLALVGLVALVASVGCENAPDAPPPAVPVAPAPPPPPAATADPTPVAVAPQKQLITVTTKSPDAKAALLKALDLSDNGRTVEALDLCKQALAADSDFAFAHACIGMLTSGASAQAEADKGVQLAARPSVGWPMTITGKGSAAGAAGRYTRAELAPADPFPRSVRKAMR